MGGRHLHRPTSRQLFVGIGHHETAGVELSGSLLDELFVLGEIAIAGHVHTVNIRFRFAVDHPFCK